MWALPNQKQISENYIRDVLGQKITGQLWVLILFSSSPDLNKMTEEINSVWGELHSYLGCDSHIILLLDKEKKGKVSFLENYGDVVGSFCRDIGIKLDKLPVLCILEPYREEKFSWWSLEKGQSISEICRRVAVDLRDATVAAEGVRAIKSDEDRFNFIRRRFIRLLKMRQIGRGAKLLAKGSGEFIVDRFIAYFCG